MLREQPLLSTLTEGKVWSAHQLAADILIPVTNYLPPREPGAQANQPWVIRPRRSKELVRADVALISTHGKVPVRQRKGVVAHQSLQSTEMH